MFICLLSLLLFQCHASADLAVFEASKYSFRYLHNPTDEQKALVTGANEKEVGNFSINQGEYELAFKEEKRIGRTRNVSSFIATLGYYNKTSDSNIEGGIDVRPDENGKFQNNLRLMLNPKNFADARNSSVVLVKDEIFIPFKEVLPLCFDKSCVKIKIPENFQYRKEYSNDLRALFDKGIIDECMGIRVHPDNLVTFVMDLFVKFDDSDLNWYEKIIKLFDSTYLYTKGIYSKDSPVWKTMRYSRAFRKNLLKYVLLPTALVIIISTLLIKNLYHK